MKNNLSMLMGKERISAVELSKETRISRSTIHGLYHERTKNPDTKTVMTLCDFFGVTPNEFFGIEEKGGDENAKNKTTTVTN
ncbi:hypothetical protein HMPREF9310_02107 [Staphylococcus simulans ACS-120-V-Sch1]|uniref:helix-turn-helix domain-containing protein n=1 Tax=Staphylococcus simulans TaxID=1286 RepID=UPI00029920EB|nr:helix-turn-helix transcriptional regulator [Staphylococcus simulans]EKS24280.1 hypothetical protein HMPREF9310_02107 [Staphylococcus simulans ACS-120-V-Sch1]